MAIILLLQIFGIAVKAQEKAAANSNQANANIAPAATVSPTPIPFSEIVARAESASASLKELGAGVSADTTAENVERGLPSLTDDIDAKLEETGRIIEGRPSLERLKSFETDWKTLAKNLPKWNDDLTSRAKKLEGDLGQLNTLEDKWKKTLDELETAVETPPEVTARIEEIITSAAQIRTQIEAEQSRIVALQSKVAEQQKRVNNALESIKQKRESLVGKLLVRDSPAIWNTGFWTRARTDAASSVNNSFAVQVKALTDFAGRNLDKILIHFLVFALFAGILIFLRRRARPWTEKEPELKNAAIIFHLPVATALILAILVSSWIYPPTPQMLGAIFGAIALVPTIIILRKLVERPLYPLLYSLVVFYFIDQLRVVAEPIPVYSRLLLLAEMLGGFLFFLWLFLARLSKNETEEIIHGKIFRTIKIAALIALPIFAVSFLTNAFGYVSLSRLLGNAVLRSAYAAVILYAAVRIIDGLIIFALRFRPLSLLKMVQHNRALIQSRLRKFLRFLAFISWIILTLELLSLREPIYEWIKGVLTASLTWGSLNISLGEVLLFIATVWAAFLLSRFINFVLEEDVYPRFSLERGIPYAISTMLRYVILLFGFFFAVAAVGFDLTKFTVLVGAFGVGIGFGLQNIINNFVSGIILLFERPVKVGDSVKIADASGIVRHIGIRASLVQTWDDAEIIVPTSKL
ncbi:MAG: mechanosensitive ion channel domain-containing protein, partial [Acidobacteriota bacterium]